MDWEKLKGDRSNVIDISQVYVIIYMEEEKRKEIIKSNQMRLRTQTLQLFGGLPGIPRKQSNFQKEPRDPPPVKPVNRKTSQDLSTFNNPHKTKEILVSSTFESLFEIFKNKLGEGAQSVVKKCKQKYTGKIYAVKLFGTTDEEIRTNIKMQYKILKSLSHINIIQPHFLFENQKDGSCQLVMELCDYPSLRRYMQDQVVIGEEETAVIIRKLLLAIAFMNEKGVCHRDIKPENVLYDPVSNSLKLIDFETAKTFMSSRGPTEMWTNTGTIYYKAPETFDGRYSENVDVWAIGILTFELLTGKLPFHSHFVKDTAHLIRNTEPEFHESISCFAKDFIKRCLIKQSSLRPKAVDILSSPFLLCSNLYISSPSPKGSTNLNRSFDEKTWKNQLYDLNRAGEDGDLSDDLIGEDIGIRKFVEWIDDS